MKNEDVVHIIIILMYTHKCHKKLLKNLVLLSAMHDIKFFIFRYISYLTLDIYIFRKSNIWTLTTRWRWEGHLGNNLSFMILCQCMSMFRLFGLNPILTSSFSPSCKKHPKKSRFGAGRSWASFCLTMTKCYEYELCVLRESSYHGQKLCFSVIIFRSSILTLILWIW